MPARRHAPYRRRVVDLEVAGGVPGVEEAGEGHHRDEGWGRPRRIRWRMTPRPPDGDGLRSCRTAHLTTLTTTSCDSPRNTHACTEASAAIPYKSELIVPGGGFHTPTGPTRRRYGLPARLPPGPSRRTNTTRSESADQVHLVGEQPNAASRYLERGGRWFYHWATWVGGKDVCRDGERKIVPGRKATHAERRRRLRMKLKKTGPRFAWRPRSARKPVTMLLVATCGSIGISAVSSLPASATPINQYYWHITKVGRPFTTYGTQQPCLPVSRKSKRYTLTCSQSITESNSVSGSVGVSIAVLSRLRGLQRNSCRDTGRIPAVLDPGAHRRRNLRTSAVRFEVRDANAIYL